MNSPWTISLPIPPGVNALYLNRGKAGMKGRMVSPEYMTWRNEAQAALWKAAPVPSFTGRVTISMECGEPRGLADLDGKWKACLDLLVRHKIIVNDDRRYVRQLLAKWVTGKPDCSVTVSAIA